VHRRVDGEALTVLNLSETIVPAMVTAVAPIIAPDQIIFLLGKFTGTFGSETYERANRRSAYWTITVPWSMVIPQANAMSPG
jgi:hypothetical protein